MRISAAGDEAISESHKCMDLTSVDAGLCRLGVGSLLALGYVLLGLYRPYLGRWPRRWCAQPSFYMPRIPCECHVTDENTNSRDYSGASTPTSPLIC